MYTADAARNRFSAGNLEGVPGPRIVVMCFDRLQRDLAEAITAIEARDHYQANAALCHAQDLITELALMVDADAWEHTGALLALYDYLLRLLPVANMKKDLGRVNEAMRHIVQLGSAFREAERSMAAHPVAPALAVDAELDTAPHRRIWVQA